MNSINDINGIIITGNARVGNNIVIINGNVVSGNSSYQTQKIDERKFQSAENVESISVHSSVCNVNIFATDSPRIEAHLHGEASIDGKVDFDVNHHNKRLEIDLEYTGACFNGALSLDIAVPYKTFEMLSVQSASADITLDESVSARFIKLNTKSGNLEINSKFQRLEASTASGDIDLCTYANEDINIDISSMSGNIEVEIENARNMNVSAQTMSGHVRKRNKPTATGHNVHGKISTMSGTIIIR